MNASVVVVGVDGSQASGRAVEEAAAQAQRWRQPLHVMHAAQRRIRPGRCRLGAGTQYLAQAVDIGSDVLVARLHRRQRLDDRLAGLQTTWIFIGIFAFCATLLLSLLGSACGAWALGAGREVLLSLAPKSITTPIAMGVAEQIGAPLEVYRRPASTFVASFIGSPPMNLLKDAQGGRAGTITGIRPEHLDVGSSGWEVRTETVELLGAERLIYGRINGEQIIVRIEEGRPAPVTDQVIRVKPREDRLHWFDGASGKRLDA